MDIDLNFADLYSSPNGYYRLVLDECRYALSKSSGIGMIKIEASIVDSPVEAFEGKKVFANVSFSPKAKFFTTRFLEAVTGDEWRSDNMSIKVNPLDETDETFDSDYKAGQFIDPDLDGETVVGLLRPDEYEGRVNSKVTDWFPDNGDISLGEFADDEDVPTFSE